MKKIEKLYKKFTKIKDEWRGIDRKILKPVIALNLIGFRTSGSCEGHLNKNSPVPWIKISPSLKIKDKNKILKNCEFKIKKLLKLFYKNKKIINKKAQLVITKGNYGFWIHPNKILFKKWRKIVLKSAIFNQNNKNKKIKKLDKIKKEFAFPKITKKELSVYRKEFNLFADFILKKFLAKNKVE